jgi:hypothetical protein
MEKIQVCADDDVGIDLIQVATSSSNAQTHIRLIGVRAQ